MIELKYLQNTKSLIGIFILSLLLFSIFPLLNFSSKVNAQTSDGQVLRIATDADGTCTINWGAIPNTAHTDTKQFKASVKFKLSEIITYPDQLVFNILDHTGSTS